MHFAEEGEPEEGDGMCFANICRDLRYGFTEKVDSHLAATGSNASRWLAVRLVRLDGWFLEYLTKWQADSGVVRLAVQGAGVPG